MSAEDVRGAAAAIRLSETPYILFAEDVALHFRLEKGAARRAILDGRLGPWFRVNGEPAVLRDTVRIHLGLLTAQRDSADRELLSARPNGLRNGGAGGMP